MAATTVRCTRHEWGSLIHMRGPMRLDPWSRAVVSGALMLLVLGAFASTDATASRRVTSASLAAAPTVEVMRRGADIPELRRVAESSVPTIAARFPGMAGSTEPSDGSIAAGVSHIVEATNAGVAIFNKNGAALSS